MSSAYHPQSDGQTERGEPVPGDVPPLLRPWLPTAMAPVAAASGVLVQYNLPHFPPSITIRGTVRPSSSPFRSLFLNGFFGAGC